MKTRAFLLSLLLLASISPVVSAESEIEILVDWNGNHSYRILGATGSDTITFEQLRGGEVLASDSITTWTGDEGVLDVNTSLELGDIITITVADQSRTFTVGTWNQPLEDHEVTLSTEWIMDQQWDNEFGEQRYFLAFDGEGWQSRTGDQLDAWEMGSGQMVIIESTNESTTNTTLILDSIWRNETTIDGRLISQIFDARGHGVLSTNSTDSGDALAIDAIITDARILRNMSYGIVDEYFLLEANGNMSLIGNDDESETNIDGVLAVIFIETRDVDGNQTLNHMQLEGSADLSIVSDDARFDIELDQFQSLERWENGVRVEQYYEVDGDGTFGVTEDEENASVNINGTVIDFHNKIENGIWQIDDFHVDGTISGDASGTFGIVRAIEDSGQIANDTGSMIDVIIVHQEDWFNLTGAGGWSANGNTIGSTHNESWSYDAIYNYWDNRTVKSKWRQTGPDPSEGEELKERSPIEKDPQPPVVEGALGDVTVNRESGLMPIPAMNGDSFLLDSQEGITLMVQIQNPTEINLDGHTIMALDWSGVYGDTLSGNATGSIIIEGPLAGLNGLIQRTLQAPFGDDDALISIVENQSVNRILSPSVVSSSDNTPPEIQEIRLRESVTAEGGQGGHLEVTVSDIDFNVVEVTADLSAIGQGVVQLSDKGLQGDSKIGDDIWTIFISNPTSNHGEISIPITITDVFAASDSQDGIISILNQAPRLTSIQIIPTTLARGQMAIINAQVSDYHGVSSVFVDMRDYGGDLVSMNLVEETWVTNLTIPYSMSPGERTLSLILEDLEGGVKTVSSTQKSGQYHIADQNDKAITLTIINTPPEIEIGETREFELGDVNVNYTISINVNDTDGVTSVQAKLGAFSEPGKDSDWINLQYQGEGVWSKTFTVRKGTNYGTHEVLFRATDAFGATSSDYSLAINVVELGQSGGPIDDISASSSIVISALAIFAIAAIGAVIFMVRGGKSGGGFGDS